MDFGGYFASLNRNKRGLVLDFKKPKHKQALLKLCESADAIVENNRSGVMDRLGLGYETIAARNPKIVYGCIRGFGDPRTGESHYANWPAFDIVAQAMGGFAHITGPDEGGYPSGVSVGDIYPGTLMALGLVSAVYHAKRTGKGQFFDVAMLDGIMALSETVIANYGFGRNVLGPRGKHHPFLMPFGIYPAKDGMVALAVLPPPHWEYFCQTIGRADLIDDPRTRNTFTRKRNQAFLDEIITQWTSARTRQEVVEAPGGHVPCGPVNTTMRSHESAVSILTRSEEPHEQSSSNRRNRPPGAQLSLRRPARGGY